MARVSCKMWVFAETNSIKVHLNVEWIIFLMFSEKKFSGRIYLIIDVFCEFNRVES